MSETNSEVTRGVGTSFEAARKRIQEAAQRAQNRAKEFVSSATTTANKLVEPMHEKFKPVQEKLKPVQEKLVTVGADAAANVEHLKERANGVLSRARSNAGAVAGKLQAQTRTAVETIQANPRVVEAMENPKVAAAVERVSTMAKSVRATIEPYVRRSLH